MPNSNKDPFLYIYKVIMEIFPRNDDPFFSEKIAMMEDFGIFKIPAMDKILTEEAFQQTADTLCKFEKTYYQHFVSQYINKRSPYQSILLYHGLGSGKTCSAITIAETFLVNHRIYDEPTVWVISKKSLKKSFQQEIFRMILLTTPEYLREQCTGDMYHQMIPDAEKLAPQKLVSRIEKTIRSRYAFFGYEEFGNMITKYQNAGILSEKIKNKVIIVDEAHNIRNSDSTIKKKTIEPILAFLKASNKNRLVFLSATPMFNEAKEILWLMSLLMLNDKVPTTLDPSNLNTFPSFYTTDNTPIPATFELMKTLASKYISYVRGSNPLTFAVRVHPSKLPGIPMLKTVPKLNFQGENIEANQLNWLASVPDGIVTSALTGLQLKNFRNLQNKKINLSKPKMRQLNNITYSEYLKGDSESESNSNSKSNSESEKGEGEGEGESEKGESEKPVEGREGRKGFLTIMRRNTDGTYEYHDSSHPILDPEKKNLINHSTKFKTIADLIRKSHGIVVIYSNFIWGGIVPLAIMFEHMGFSRYGTKNLLKDQHNKIDNPVRFKDIARPKYAILSGENDKDKGVMGKTKIDDLLMTINDTEKNKNGEEVKLILMSPVASEGLTFKNVREIHILEPWYHLNTGEQAIGRAIRHCSHSSLPINKRNVSVFLHATVFPKNEIETEDLYAYRLSAMKRYQVDSVDKLIKENALDCTLMQNVNYFPTENFAFMTTLKTSHDTTIAFKYGDPEEKALRCAAADKAVAVAVDVEKRAFRDVSYASFVPTLQLKLQKYLKRAYMNDHIQEFSYEELLEVIHPNKEVAHKTIEASLYPYKLWDTFGLIYHYNKFIITEFKKESLRPIRLQIEHEKEITDEEDVENADNLIDLFKNITENPTRAILDIYKILDSKSWYHFAERLIKTPKEIPKEIEPVLAILEREGAFVLRTELPTMPNVEGKYIGYINIFADVAEFKGFVFDSTSNSFEELSSKQILTIKKKRNYYPYTNPSKMNKITAIGMIVPECNKKSKNTIYRFEFKIGFDNNRSGRLGVKCESLHVDTILKELNVYVENTYNTKNRTLLCYYLMDHLLKHNRVWIPVEYKLR